MFEALSDDPAFSKLKKIIDEAKDKMGTKEYLAKKDSLNRLFEQKRLAVELKKQAQNKKKEEQALTNVNEGSRS